MTRAAVVASFELRDPLLFAVEQASAHPNQLRLVLADTAGTTHYLQVVSSVVHSLLWEPPRRYSVEVLEDDDADKLILTVWLYENRAELSRS